jgi:DNA-binding response OmpR family regulator
MRVLVIEDEFAIAKSIRDALERDRHEIALATNASEGLGLADTWKPEMVLLDLALPDADGRDVCRVLRAASDVPIIIITAHGEETDRIVGLELGADDYLVKPFGLGELNARIRAVMRRTRGGGLPERRRLEFRDLIMEPDEHRLLRSDEAIDLTPREFQILRVLLEAGPGRLVPRADLARAIWGRSSEDARGSLDFHVSTLRAKLGDDARRPRYVQTVRGLGFRLPGADVAH